MPTQKWLTFGGWYFFSERKSGLIMQSSIPFVLCPILIFAEEMSAYAALVSLCRTVGSSLDEGGMRIGRIRGELQALNLKVISLLSLLENSATNQSSQVSALETRMRDAAYKAEDLIVESGAQDSELRRLRKLVKFTFRCFVHAAAVVSPKVILMLDVAVGDLAAFAICIIFALLLHLLLPPDDFPALTDYTPRDLSGVIKEFSDIEKEAIQKEEESSAHAALISLRQNLDSVLDSEQRELLHQKVTFLLDFLKNASNYMTSQKSALQNLDKNIRSEARNAKSALMESPTPAHPTRDSHSMNFSVFVKASLLTTLSSLPACAVLTTIMLFVMDYRSPQQTQLLVDWFIAIAYGFGSLVLGVSGALAVYLAMATKDNSKAQESRIQNLSREIYRFHTLVVEATRIMDAGGNPTNLGRTVNNDPVGLESDTVQIRDLLFQDSSHLEFISIVGVGGIGKTTLARKVYNGSDINQRFDIWAWVTILQQHSPENVLQDLLASVKKFTNIPQGRDEGSGVCLHQILWGRRYLIVMDGVWDRKILDEVTIYFPNDQNKSRVLLTSQLSDVASDFRNVRVHKMPCLDEDKSWDLLRKTVFGENKCPRNLESIGKEVARSCGGLRLAIVVTGGLLYKEDKSEVIWREIAKSLPRQTGEQCLEILGLSYNRLPHHLRPCFLYMGVFKGDTDIPVSTLINLWAAEGFLNPCKPSDETLEEVGLRYLNELIVRNLILVRNRSSNGMVKTCSIHGLLRDVSVQNARKEDFLHVVESGGQVSSDDTPRRVSIHPDALQNDAWHELIRNNDTVRSFLCFGSNSIENSDVFDLGFFMYLRVLDLLAVHFGQFPQQITQLLRLRYLAFHCDGSLPPSISNLHNLHTLVVHHLSIFTFLPSEILRMPNLRHLYVKPGCYLSNPFGFWLPWKSCALQHLQTLKGIRNLIWSRNIIQRILNLKKLVILYDVPSSVHWSKYKLKSLANLRQLQSLKIIIEYSDAGSGIFHDPPELAFPETLKKLSLSGCRIPWASMTTIGALPNLEALKLRCEAFSGDSWETVEGEFPQLIFLLLEDMSLRGWDTKKEDHFPRLQRVVLRSCRMLKEIPYAVGDIPTLKSIKLVNCPKSAVDSANAIKEYHQRENGDDSLQVQSS